MKFSHPEILWALTLVVIPVIIHLFNFKRFKKVYFPNLAFLRTVEQQTKKHSQLRHLIILASRILFVAALVLAFAKPYFTGNNDTPIDGGQRRIAVFLDNSFSMQQKGRKGILLEEGRGIAREIIQSFNPTDRFKLLTNNPESFEGEFVSRDDFMSDLRDCDFEPYSIKLSEVINESGSPANDAKDKPTDVFIISDFQQRTTDIDKWQPDSATTVNLIPLASAGVNNVFIDSCSIDDPAMLSGKPVVLKYRIAKNFDDPVENLSIRLFINGRQKAVSTVDLTKDIQQESFTFIPDSSEIQFGRIEITDYPVSFDDNFFFSFRIKKSFTVTIISSREQDDYISRFYKNDSTILLQKFSEKRIDYSALPGSNVIILNEPEEMSSGLIDELKKYTNHGGKLVFIPKEKTPVEQINFFNNSFGLLPVSNTDTSKIRLENIDLQSVLFKDVFKLKNGVLPENTSLPFFKYRLKIHRSINGLFKSEMSFADGDPLLLSSKIGKGKLFYFTAALNKSNSNMNKHIRLFIPMFYNFAAIDDNNRPLFYRTDVRKISVEKIKTDTKTVFHIIKTENGSDFIPRVKEMPGETMIFPEGRIKESGNYIMKSQTEKQNKYSIPLSFDYPSDESYFNNFSQEEISNLLKKHKKINVKIIDNQGQNIGAKLTEEKADRELWKIFILTALMFLLIEVFLLRFWK